MATDHGQLRAKDRLFDSKAPDRGNSMVLSKGKEAQPEGPISHRRGTMTAREAHIDMRRPLSGPFLWLLQNPSLGDKFSQSFALLSISKNLHFRKFKAFASRSLPEF